MATVNLTLNAPDGTVPLLRRTLGTFLGTTPTTPAETKAALEAYIKKDLKERMRDQKRYEADEAAKADGSDGLETW